MVGVGVLAGAGFGEVGEPRASFKRMVKGMTRLKEISENVGSERPIERRDVCQGALGRVHGNVPCDRVHG